MITERYGNIDGIRVYACFGIILMHVLHFGYFQLSGFIFEKLIPSFTHFTTLFMIISSFSMCCGYYDRIQNGTISVEKFYIRRIKKIWPFFSLFCTIELIVNHDINSLYEWFADITLVFGFIPNHEIKVVGVGWFIGIVFIFYFIFPFFVFLMKNKKRAWIIMFIAILLHILCLIRFKDTGRKNIIYSGMYFVAGGIIYLYKDKLNNITAIVAALFSILSCICFYVFFDSEIVLLVLNSCILIAAISFAKKNTKSENI